MGRGRSGGSSLGNKWRGVGDDSGEELLELGKTVHLVAVGDFKGDAHLGGGLGVLEDAGVEVRDVEESVAEVALVVVEVVGAVLGDGGRDREA